MDRIDLETANPELYSLWEAQPQKFVASIEAINRLEAAVGARMPISYRNFLIDYGYVHNGDPTRLHIAGRIDMGTSVVNKPIVFTQITDIDSSEVDGVWRSGVVESHEDLQEAVTEDEEGSRIPPDTVPIGIGSSDTEGRFLLDVSEENYGRIWYWEFSFVDWGDVENQSLAFVAKDFETFIADIGSWEGGFGGD